MAVGYLASLGALRRRRIARPVLTRVGSFVGLAVVVGTAVLALATGALNEQRALDFTASGGLNSRDIIWQRAVDTALTTSPVAGIGFGVGALNSYVAIFTGTGVVRRWRPDFPVLPIGGAAQRLVSAHVTGSVPTSRVPGCVLGSLPRCHQFRGGPHIVWFSARHRGLDGDGGFCVQT